MNTLALIETFRQMALKNNNDLNCTFATDSSVDLNSSSASLPSNSANKLPAFLRSTLSAMGIKYSNLDYVGPYGNVQGTGFGTVKLLLS